MSDEPVNACRPLFLLSMFRHSLTVMPLRLQMNSTTAGSSVPERVPITRPSSGVRPMEVSVHLPSTHALSEEPLPRWQMMTLLPFGRPSSSCVRAAM